MLLENQRILPQQLLILDFEVLYTMIEFEFEHCVFFLQSLECLHSSLELIVFLFEIIFLPFQCFNFLLHDLIHRAVFFELLVFLQRPLEFHVGVCELCDLNLFIHDCLPLVDQFIRNCR